MVRVSVRMVKDGDRPGVEVVEVQAESIEGALEVVRARNPDAECEMEFPIDPERFFVDAFSEDVVTAEDVAA